MNFFDIEFDNQIRDFKTFSTITNWVNEGINGKAIKFLHINIRSIHKNWNDLLLLSDNFRGIDVVVLTETNTVNENMPGYTILGFNKKVCMVSYKILIIE